MSERTGSEGEWAKPVGKLTAGGAPAGAPNLVEGKRLVGVVQGFGKLWQKTYKVRLDGVEMTPAGRSSRRGGRTSPATGRRATTSTRRSRASSRARWR